MEVKDNTDNVHIPTTKGIVSVTARAEMYRENDM